MGKAERNPADYDSWWAWQTARERDGKMPINAKPVPIAAIAVAFVLALTWFVVDQIGGTLEDDIRRSGTATVTGECRAVGTHFRCPAQISWGESTDVWSTDPISGTVEVDERLSFEPETRQRASTDVPQVWASDHTPTPRPWMFPVVYGGVGVIALVLGGVGIVFGGRLLERRSRAQWASARRAAGRSAPSE